MEVSTSNAFKEHLAKLKVSEQQCPKHDQPLVITPQGSSFCPACRKEKIQQETEDWAEESYQAHLRRKSKANWLASNSILSDDSLKEVSFASFEVEIEEERKNKEQVEELAKRYRNGDNFNTIITGSAGVGKSHLAMALLKEINQDNQLRVMFVSVDELFRLIKDSFSTNNYFTEQYAAELLRQPDILVLDDLGSEVGAIGSGAASDFVNRTLYGIINGRLNKSTVVTTNLSSKQLASKYDEKLLSRLYKGIKANKSIVVFKETKDKRMDLEF